MCWNIKNTFLKPQLPYSLLTAIFQSKKVKDKTRELRKRVNKKGHVINLILTLKDQQYWT